jgi:hypothetical protein
MSPCSYCGLENPDDVLACPQCGTEAPERIESAPDPKRHLLDPRFPELTVDSLFPRVEGLTRPDWGGISAIIHELAKSDWNNAWLAVASEWLTRLSKDSAGDYKVTESANFFCWSEMTTERVGSVFKIAEYVVKEISAKQKQPARSDF